MIRLKHLTLSLIAALSSQALADTIVLKSGQKYRGRIISQDAKSYLLEINITKTIKDERRISKDLIDKIIREEPDTKAFNKVAKLVPTPDLLPQAEYQQRIGSTKAFITEFPQSKYIKEANKILATLETENHTITSGGIKFDGQLISQPDKEANAYEINANILLREIEQLSKAKKYRDALRKWEKLRKDYKSSTSFQAGIPIIQRTLQNYQHDLKQLENTLEKRIKKQKTALLSMKEHDRERTVKVLEENQRKYKSLIDKEQNQLKIKWLTVNPYDKSSLTKNQQLASSELNHLKNADLKQIKLAGQDYRDAWANLAGGNLELAATHIAKLKSLKIPKQYLAPLQEKLAEKLQTQQDAERKAKEEAEKKAEAKRLAEIAEKESQKEATKKKRGKKSKEKNQP